MGMILNPLFKNIINKVKDFILLIKIIRIKNNQIKDLKLFYSSTITLSLNSDIDNISSFISVI
jgi:hypothetical protein